MNTRSLFLIFLVIGLMCGSASAAQISQYDFDEGIGTDVGDSIGGYNGTRGVDTTWGIDYLTFDNKTLTTSLVTVADVSALDFTNESFTIITQIVPYDDLDDTDQDISFVTKRSATYSSNGWAVGVEEFSGQAMCIWLTNTNTVSDTGLAWEANQSYWLGYSYNATSKEVIFNRNMQDVGSATFSGTTSAVANSNDIKLGSKMTSGYGLTGDMYELLIFDKALTQSEMSSYMTAANKEIYVATNGSDITGNGSESNPYATVTKALDVASGIGTVETIYVADGFYNEMFSVSVDDIIIKAQDNLYNNHND